MSNADLWLLGIKEQLKKIAGKLTAGVTVAGTVTVDTEFGAAAALTDNFANPTVPGVGSFGMLWDGAWDRAPGNSVDGASVKITNASIAVTVSSGTITGAVAGTTAHDGVGTAVNPVAMGGYASAAAPSNVSTTTDIVRAWFLLNGAQATVVTAAGALIGGDAANGLDVDVTRLPALVAGSANIGDVDVLTVPADPFGLNADAASASGSISAKLRFIASTGIPITGTVTVASHAVTNAGVFAVQATGTVTASNKSATGTLTSVAASATSVTILAANAARNGAIIYNDSATATLKLKYGTTASATSFTGLPLRPGAGVSIDDGYTGRIDGIWDAASGDARITELTA